MATVAVLDYFLTLEDEVCDSDSPSSRARLNMLVADHPHVEETEVMDVLCIPSGEKVFRLRLSSPTHRTVYRTGIPSWCSYCGSKWVGTSFPATGELPGHC